MLSALNAFSSALSMFSALNAFSFGGIKKTVTSSSNGNSNTLPGTLRPISKIGDADSEAIWRSVTKFPHKHMLIPKHNNEYSDPVPDPLNPGRKRKQQVATVIIVYVITHLYSSYITKVTIICNFKKN